MEKPAVPEGTWKVIGSTNSAVQAVLLRSLPELRGSGSQEGTGGRLAPGPRRAVGVKVGDTRRARAGAETQWFFWQLAEVGIQETGFEDHSTQGHR